MKIRRFPIAVLATVVCIAATVGCSRSVRDGVSIGVTDGLSEGISTLLNDFIDSLGNRNG